MYSALFYKEWLKVRWAVFGLTILSLLVLTYIALDLAYYVEFMTAVGFWGNVILLGMPFFTDIRYTPLLSGIIVAIVQFSPEMNLSRLKLTLHLPVEENKLLFQMISVGLLLLVLLFLIITILLWIIIGIYFPVEVVRFALNSLALWLLGGIAAYFLTSAIILEPVWTRRLILIPVALGFIDLFYSSGNPHIQLTLFFIITSVVAALLISYSGYHFKRGIK